MHTNRPENITELHAFCCVCIIVWAGILLGHRTDLQIYSRGSVTAVCYRNEVLGPIMKLYAAVVGLSFILMDDYARPHSDAIIDGFLESEESGEFTRPIFRIPGALLYVDPLRGLEIPLQEK